MTFAEHISPQLRPPTPPVTPIVYVVDDDVSVRESLELLIRCAGWQSRISASAEEFLARPRVVTPSCLLLDVSLPNISGLDLQRLVADRAELPIIFITGHGDIPMAVRAIKVGAVEFFAKPFVGHVLLGAIRDALTRSDAAIRHDAQLSILRERYQSLSRRERKIMALVVAGRLNKQVAGELALAEITVKVHRAQVMQKMKADSFAHLVNMAVRLRIEPEPDRPSTSNLPSPTLLSFGS